MLSPTRARGVPFGWLFIGYANLLYPAGVMGWLSNVFCPLLGLGVSLPCLKCVGLPPTPLVGAFPRLAGTEQDQRCGRLPPRMFLLSSEDCESVHLWFGWLFIG